MEDSGLTCDAEDCAFATPNMDADLYPAMVAHLQVIVHNSDNYKYYVAGFRYTQPPNMGSTWERWFQHLLQQAGVLCLLSLLDHSSHFQG